MTLWFIFKWHSPLAHFLKYQKINYSFQAFAGQDDGTTDQAILTNENEDLEMKSEDRTINCVIINFLIFTSTFGLFQASNCLHFSFFFSFCIMVHATDFV
jgi:hypothetical protein